MKVQTVFKFYDLKENVLREVGDVFEVTKGRYQEILSKGGRWVDVGKGDSGKEDSKENGKKNVEVENDSGKEDSKGKAANE